MPFRIALLLFILSSIHANVWAQSTTCPPNLDFETGTYNNWRFFTGTCCPLTTPNSTAPITAPAGGTRHALTNGTNTDMYGGFPIVSPGGGSYSLKLGNDLTGSQAERARYFVQVPPSASTYVLVFRYAVVFQDPQHTVAEQPRFQVSAYDSATGDLIPCSDVTYISSAALPGFQLSSQGTQVYYKNWAAASIFLGNYVAGKTVAVDFATGDCGAGAHFGYAYVDMNCGLFQTYYDIKCSPSSTVTLTAPPGYQKYEWMDSGLTKTLSINPTFLVGVPDSTTVFAVILTPFASFGCKDTLYATVANLRVQATMDTIVCINSGTTSIQLDTRVKGDASPFIYNWYPSTGLSCTNCPNPVATVGSTIKYYVTVTDSGGCTKMDSTLITVEPPVIADIKFATDTICQYEQIAIDNIGINPENVVHYWDVDTGMIHTGEGGPAIVASWGTPGPKKIRLRSTNVGCFGRDSADIFIKPAPVSSFDMKHNICVNEVTRLYPREDAGSNYYWTIEEGAITDNEYKEYFDISWTTTGKKKVSLKVTGANGCSATYDTAIKVHGYPSGKISMKQPEVCIGDTLTFSTEYDDYYSYKWSPAGYFLSSSEAEVRGVPDQSRFVSLEVKSQWGCNITDSIYVGTEKCCKIVVPDAFTPNEDGHNDKFHFISLGENQIHTYLIMNRWGKVVYSSQANDGWDGTYKGEPQDPGTYMYYVKFICSTGKIQESKGTFFLIK